MSISEKIKQMPDNQKKIFALFIALLLTVVIVGSWFSFSNNKSDKNIVENEPSTLSSISPLKMIKEEFSNVFSGIGEQISALGSEATETASTSVQVEIVTDAMATGTATSTSAGTTTEIEVDEIINE